MCAFAAFLLVLLSLPMSVFAQQQTIHAAPQKNAPEYYAQDGGVREIMESIVIPPKVGAPFTFTLETEWVRTMYDGGTITLVNQRRIARDSKGRVYQERWLLVPKNGSVESKMNAIQIFDPNAHTRLSCFLLEKPHQCVLEGFAPSTSTVYNQASPPPGELANGMGTSLHEDLGTQLIEGLETTGTRDSVIYDPGILGNDRKMTVDREYWYSEKLGLNLLSIRSDPRFGKQTFRATNLMLSEPDPELFELPAGFTVVDQRQSVAPDAN
jgi:hypothetical protein